MIKIWNQVLEHLFCANSTIVHFGQLQMNREIAMEDICQRHLLCLRDNVSVNNIFWLCVNMNIVYIPKSQRKFMLFDRLLPWFCLLCHLSTIKEDNFLGTFKEFILVLLCSFLCFLRACMPSMSLLRACMQFLQVPCKSVSAVLV